YWTPMVSARPLSERLGRWTFGLMFAGMHLAFLPMHLTGLMGMPRRVYTYAAGRDWEWPNLISSIGAFVFAAGVLIWLIDMIRNFRPFGSSEAGNVYDGGGLEWLPAGLYSTRSIPVVRSLYPLWDQKNLARDVAAGRYFLPGAPTGGRETLVTSPVNAEPQHLLRMPVPSGWHVWAAVFTAGFFLLLTVQAYAASVLSGVLAILCVLRWCWFLDHPLPQQTVDVGAGIELPTYASGPSSTGWWAMIVTLVVGGMVLAMSVFSYVFLWSRNPDAWRPPPDTASLAVATLSAATGGALALLARRQLARPWLATAMVLAGAALLTLAFGVDLSSWRATGLSPQASAQGAIVHAILAWQGFFVAVAAIMALYVLMRRLYGYVGPDRPATIELVGLFLAYTAGQGLVGLGVTRLFPAGLT
ncbi:cbb3-type cytochrome c oxidase subunit I, partial [Caulobacter sp. CCNWLY153]|uniref:cbb3-type cytochrome c oxidase subunit I n=1 Tax=unclassified Caulobacter TaxID=2648921 RepID=UPI002FF13689